MQEYLAAVSISYLSITKQLYNSRQNHSIQRSSTDPLLAPIPPQPSPYHKAAEITPAESKPREITIGLKNPEHRSQPAVFSMGINKSRINPALKSPNLYSGVEGWAVPSLVLAHTQQAESSEEFCKSQLAALIQLCCSLRIIYPIFPTLGFILI